MDTNVLQDLAQHYEEKINKKRTGPRRQISHIDAFYGQSHSGGLLKQRDSFGGSLNPLQTTHNESALSLNLLISRAQ